MLTEKLFIEPPCIFCGYEGPNFYQAGSHKPNCPYHNIGGAFKREEYIVEMARSGRVIVAPESTTTKTEWVVQGKYNSDGENSWHDIVASVDKYGFPDHKEDLEKEALTNGLGYEYRIIRREIREYVEATK